MKNYALYLLLFSLLFACESKVEKAQIVTEDIATSYIPEWAKDASIYEVNMRQFTEEGTFEAFSKHLPRIKDMGIKIIWLMPIHPISVKERKGTLGSPYAVADYKDVNPEYGTMADFEAMVKKIHDLDMKIIIDWVPNHTGWDNQWITDHPEWYTQNDQGEIIDPIDYNTGESWGWTDVADLNYDNQEMRKEMISVLKYWINERNIDGFRMDVAHGVPDDFWMQANEELKKQGDIFLLAEGEVPKQRNAGGFHADYGWSLHHLLNEVAKGEKSVDDIWTYYEEDSAKFEKGYHMMFTSNHDENTWAGTVFERMEDAHKAMAVFTATFDGMPLIYGGQEEPLMKRLEFFEKDDIGFENYEYQEFYTTLFNLKKQNEALWNGEFGAPPTRISEQNNIMAFQRKKDSNTVLTFINFTNSENSISLGENFDLSTMKVLLSETVKLSEDQLTIGPWGYVIYSN
ncbi:alpha-amylase family glycosyl hydrolase [Portibacter lacus]|uniref:Alpha-amylase n=1 Tax=Portibacter lacus TaxID=1099794 RepID=A0AA37SQB4_9BACT|nr:alpha-amylase family glycosyl hydrolase [Portibacter lacus]GLR15665.1 alpha-amylase [Portibacter lacus]